MRRLIAMLILAGLFSTVSHAYNQTEICKAQCSAYELAWQDDYCYQFVKEMCAKGGGETGLAMAEYWSTMVEEDAPYMLFVEAYACVDVIKKCIVPINNACANYCDGNNLGYAPDLTVSTLYYLEENKTLLITVKNAGLAYIDGSFATTYYGFSDSINDSPQMSKVDDRAIPALRPQDVRWSPPELNYDYSYNFSYPLMKGKYNVFKVFVHADPRYQESSSDNNAMTYVVNDLPAPGELRFKDVTATRVSPSSVEFMLTSVVENAGGTLDDAKVRYYLGASNAATPTFESSVSVLPDHTVTDKKDVIYSKPYPSLMTVKLEKNGHVLDERTLFLVPQFFKFTGFVKDETGRPVANATVEASNIMPGLHSSNPQSEVRISTTTDSDGRYSFKTYLTSEGTAYLSASKPGYVMNFTAVELTYNDSGEFGFDNERYIHENIVLPQQPVELYVTYPTNGKYLIQTDKGRFSGDYLYGGAYKGDIPASGSNGSILVLSQNCSPFVSNFHTTLEGTTLHPQHVVCLSADNNDDYQVLQNDSSLWSKTYTDEEPRDVVFDKRGDHAYIMTVGKDLHCSVYAYDMATGNEQYHIRFNSSSCGMRSRMVPAYDGSLLFVGVGAMKQAKTGDTIPKGFVIAANGSVVRSFDIPQASENLDLSSATEFLDIIESPHFYINGNDTMEPCELILNKTCSPPKGDYSIKQLGLSYNRVLGTCDNKLCVFTPGYDDYSVLGGSYGNSQAASDYANNDVFVYNHQGGNYYSGTDKRWSVKSDISYASLSPGGRYLAVEYFSHGMDLLDNTGKKLTGDVDAMPIGLEATERGIFYARDNGPKVEILSLTTVVTPSSSTSSGTQIGSANFIDQLFQVVSDLFNGFMAFLKGIFGG